jgi:alpha-beta hydrolase superfamily lysophospholipase
MERGDDNKLVEKTSLEIYTEPGPNGEKFDDSLSLECDGVLGKHKLRIVAWTPATEPYGIVIIAHGLHEHALRYYNIAHELTSRGLVVYACDHYAHGKSDGVKGYITDYSVLSADFVQFSQWARRRHPDLPLSVLGHSMGSMITMLSIRGIPDLKSVVLCGIPLVPGPAAASPLGCTCLYPLSRTALAPCLTSCMAGCMPTGPAAPIDINGVSSDPKERAIILDDPLRYPGEIMNITARELMKMVNACKEETPLIVSPFLVIHGQDDTLGMEEGAQWFHDHAGTIAENKQIAIYPGLRHELFHEKAASSAPIFELVGTFLSEGVTESFQNSLIGDGAVMADIAAARGVDIELSGGPKR